MPHIEVLPNSTSIAQPGWAYVPDTGYDPSKAPIQPSGARNKRAGRNLGLTAGDATSRQQNAIIKHLAELDKDNYRDVQIAVPKEARDNVGKASRGKGTQNTRRILTSGKTFANYLADEEAALANQEYGQPSSSTPRPSASRPGRASSMRRRSSSSMVPTTPVTPTATTQTQSLKGLATTSSLAALSKDKYEDDPLLRTYIPSTPSTKLMDALVSAPPLSYNAARVGPPSGNSPNYFCEICGYWGLVKCIRCGARVCGLECKTTHDEGRCLKFYA